MKLLLLGLFKGRFESRSAGRFTATTNAQKKPQHTKRARILIVKRKSVTVIATETLRFSLAKSLYGHDDAVVLRANLGVRAALPKDV